MQRPQYSSVEGAGEKKKPGQEAVGRQNVMVLRAGRESWIQLWQRDLIHRKSLVLHSCCALVESSMGREKTR